MTVRITLEVADTRAITYFAGVSTEQRHAGCVAIATAIIALIVNQTPEAGGTALAADMRERMMASLDEIAGMRVVDVGLIQ